MPNRRFLLLIAALCAVTLAAVRASGPTFWTTAAAADFLKGTSDGVYVSLNGVVTAGPQMTNRMTSAPAQIWSLAEGPDGTMWAGTGGDGRVIRLRSGQPEQTAFDSEENNVFALAVSGTRVYVATGPDGKVYAIDGDTPARTFFDPAEKYIWALTVDATGRLWVGAGNPAVIYRVDPNGTSQVVYRPPAAHVVMLAKDSSGRVFAGTESPGRLYRFDAGDRPFVVLDSGMAELRAVAFEQNGGLFAAAVAKAEDAGSSPESTSVAATLAASASTTGTSSSVSPASSTPGARRSVLFRVDPTGTWEAIWNSPDLIYDVTAQSDGVLVATGPEGRLYKVDQNRDVLLLTGVDAKQVIRFAANARTGALSAFATANPGRVMAVGPGEQSPASYLSPVRDTKGAATWGLIRWEATGTVAMYTRSGNTEKPDDSWSPWSAAYSRREGEQVTSPPARFLQWRAVFTRPQSPPSAELTAVTVAYLTRNNRPSITSVTVYPPGVVFQRPFASDDAAIAGLDDATADARRAPGDSGPTPPQPNRRMFQRGLQTIQWKAEDSDDGDRLTYALEYRREGTTAWQELKTGLTDGIFVWDTASAPDGRYIVRVRASDSPTNAADRALTGDRESDPIEIDNTPPTFTAEVVRQGATSRLAVRVRDASSPILKVEYSMAGGPWQLLYPLDGLSDSPEERYEIALTPTLDPNRIVIRATDLLQNVMSQPAIPR